MTMGTIISLFALLISLGSLAMSFYAWRRTSRPLVTVAVKTHAAGNIMIAYDLVVQNSGALPARNIRIEATSGSLAAALGQDATAENKQRWLAAFESKIAVLQNNERVSCSFGTTRQDDAGFWKVHANIPVIVCYEGWFGTAYREEQEICIADSDSFTGYGWGAPS
jgi:hypothetical protein